MREEEDEDDEVDEVEGRESEGVGARRESGNGTQDEAVKVRGEAAASDETLRRSVEICARGQVVVSPSGSVPVRARVLARKLVRATST